MRTQKTACAGNEDNNKSLGLSKNNNFTKDNTFVKLITDTFLEGLDKNPNPDLVSPLLLAYIGDSIFDIIIRTMLVKQGNRQIHKLHAKASSYVSAAAQSVSVDKIKKYLTENEMAIFRRGRNANSHTKAKNATPTQYKRATGFEALMGYLFLMGDIDRLLFLSKIAIDEK